LKHATSGNGLAGASASPAFIGGRGLKLALLDLALDGGHRIARLHRRARIETKPSPGAP